MFAPFITEQVAALEKEGVVCRFFGIDKKGICGYVGNLRAFRRAIQSFRPDVIHAHYGLCGLLANYQRRIPVVTTYHGSDINNPRILRLSKRSIRRSRFNIFVSERNIDIAKPSQNHALIPCGINLDDYPVIEKQEARRKMGLDMSGKYVLFAGAYDNPVKNASLAKAALELIPEAQLLELKGFTRERVAALMQAVDAFLMTSHSEGSPQVIKEAMACGCPIVSVDVGDVADLTAGTEGCFIAERSPEDIASKLKMAIPFERRTEGRRVIENRGLTNERIAQKLTEIYKSII